MSMEKSPTCFYENEKISFRSYIQEFTPELFKEFDLKADNLGLHLKIDELFNGKNLNYTEGLAAWHPKYRDEYNPISNDSPSNRNQQKQLAYLNDLCDSAKNIITIGIGGSFEGPKMLLETIETGDHSDVLRTFYHWKKLVYRRQHYGSTA